MRRNPSETKKSHRDSEEPLDIDLPVELADRLMRFCERTGFEMHTVIAVALERHLAGDHPAARPPKERLQ